MTRTTAGTKADAQRRADQIAAFRDEIAALGREGLLSLSDADRARITAHQDALLAQFARDFDVDRTVAQRQMSAGMLLASIFGAAALTAAVVSFVYRVWGTMPTWGQMALVTLAPVASLGVAGVAARIEKTRYVASLFAIVSCGAFVLQLFVLAALFNLRSSPHAIGLAGGFALMVAAPWRLTVPFAMGAVALAVYAPALAMSVVGLSWTNVASRPELIGVSAALGTVALTRAPEDLARAARLLLLILALGILFLMTNRGMPSLLPLSEAGVAAAYQVLALGVTIALLFFGILRQSNDLTVLGTLFGGVFLLGRFVDWWWDWMPKYVFFLILAIVALGWLWGLRIARRRFASRPA